jgi:hypothetical protein
MSGPGATRTGRPLVQLSKQPLFPPRAPREPRGSRAAQEVRVARARGAPARARGAARWGGCGAHAACAAEGTTSAAPAAPRSSRAPADAALRAPADALPPGSSAAPRRPALCSTHRTGALPRPAPAGRSRAHPLRCTVLLHPSPAFPLAHPRKGEGERVGSLPRRLGIWSAACAARRRKRRRRGAAGVQFPLAGGPPGVRTPAARRSAGVPRGARAHCCLRCARLLWPSSRARVLRGAS